MATSAAEVVAPAEISDALLFGVFLQQLEADPLKTYRHACSAARKMCEFSNEVAKLWTLTVYWRAGNSSAKTYSGAALGVALARGLRELDGTPLPKLPVPNVGWVLVQTRLQQVDASQKAYLHWLGKWPHKISYVSGEGKGYIERIDVATAKCTHGMDARCSTCSRIMFHCAESDSSVGGRIHWAHADELPPARLWDEVVSRFSANTPFLRFITATPLYRREWAWVADYFKNCEDHIVDGRVEVRSTIYDNVFIPREQADAIVAQWEDSPIKAARIAGDYVDTEGDCPFDFVRLGEWKVLCDTPKLIPYTIMAERTTDLGRVVEPRIERLEWWGEVDRQGRIVLDPEETYLLVGDPSTGVRSRVHDPAGFHVYARRARKLVGRYDDYLEPYGLGYFMGLVGADCSNALIDVDMTGGYGGPTITALSNLRYHNINREYQEVRPGSVRPELGFRITNEVRSEITTAVMRAIVSDSVRIPSEGVISCLLGVTVDDKGKWLAKPGSGRHDEDMICMGRALHLMDTLGTPAARVFTPQERAINIFAAHGVSVQLESEEEDDEVMVDDWMEA